MEVQSYQVLPGSNQVVAQVKYFVMDPVDGPQQQVKPIYLVRGTDIEAGAIADADVVAAVTAKISAAGKVAPLTVTMIPAPVLAAQAAAQAVIVPLVKGA